MSVPTICEPFSLSTSVARVCVGSAKGAWIDIMKQRLTPIAAMNSACFPACRWLLAWVRQLGDRIGARHGGEERLALPAQRRDRGGDRGGPRAHDGGHLGDVDQL